MKTANGNGFPASPYGIVLAAGEGKRLESFVHEEQRRISYGLASHF